MFWIGFTVGAVACAGTILGLAALAAWRVDRDHRQISAEWRNKCRAERGDF